MAKQVTYSIGPVVGCGRTKTEARENAERAAADWLQRMHEDGPIVMSYRGETRMVVPNENGTTVYRVDAWERRGIFLDPEKDTARVARRTALDLAMQTWQHATDSDDPPAELAWRLGRENLTEWHSWVRFQRAYRRAESAGFSKAECHQYACGCLGHPELQARIDAALAQSVA